MATPQLSPGVLVREVDLTVGRADNVLDNIGANAGPFKMGPVDEAIDITTEQELINTFAKPQSTDAQYQYWMSAASYLSYGGVLKVVRTAGSTLQNANAGVGIAATTNCIWGLEVKALGDGETTDVAYGSAVTVTDASQGSAVELLVSPVSSAIACGGATNDLLYCQVKRDADYGSDNMAGDARLVGIKIFYTTNTGGDT